MHDTNTRPRTTARVVILTATIAFAIFCLAACSGGSASQASTAASDAKHEAGLNLADLLNESNEDAAVLKDLQEVDVHVQGVDVQDGAIYTNNETFATAIVTNDVNSTGENLQGFDGSYVIEIGAADGSPLDLAKVEGGATPDLVWFDQAFAGSNPSSEEVAKRVSAVLPYEKIVVANFQNGTIGGAALGDGYMAEVTAQLFDDSWNLTVAVYKTSGSSPFSDYSAMFGEYYGSDWSAYPDVYKS